MSDPVFTICGTTDDEVTDDVALYLARCEAPPAYEGGGIRGMRRAHQREEARLKRHRERAKPIVSDALAFIRSSVEPEDDNEVIEARCVAYCKAQARARCGVVGFVLSPFWIGIVVRIALLLVRIWLNGGLKRWAIAERQRAMGTTP